MHQEILPEWKAEGTLVLISTEGAQFAESVQAALVNAFLSLSEAFAADDGRSAGISLNQRHLAFRVTKVVLLCLSSSSDGL